MDRIFMKSLFFQALIAVAAGSAAGAQSADQYVKVKSENLRSEPGGARIGELAAGAKLKVLERQPNWIKVQVTGWMWDKSVTADSAEVEGFTVGAAHILVATEEEANRVMAELKGGGRFEDLAAKYSKDVSSASNGGDLGSFARGDLLPEFEKAVFNLKPGQTAGPVKTALGYHIIRRSR